MELKPRKDLPDMNSHMSTDNETKNAADSARAVAEDPTRPIACRSTEGAAARALTFATASRGAEPLSLAGRWRFQLDREDKGIAERWFQGSLAEAIRLPGTLQNQGFGDAITANTKWTCGERISPYLELPRYERYRQPGNVKVPFFLQPEKHYVGVAWYQRDIDIPADWSGRRVVLTLERPHWETQVWLDDRAIGSNNSLSTPHVYDLGTELKVGRHRLSIRVDNHLIVDVGASAHSVSDETQGNWNGIVGEITLTTTSLVWIEDAQAYPNVAKRGVLVRVRVGNASGKSGAGTLTVGPVSQKIDWSAAGGATETAIDLGQDARTWDEFTPVLQRLKLSLRGADADDERTLVFGLREMAVQGRQFLVNEHPTFFRGTLECCIFPLTGYPPTDVDAWKRIIRTCQAHGLNHIRFHSWCPPEAAFVAADELGFYYSVEVAAGTAVGQGRSVDQWLYGEAARILKAYGNHPSFMLMTYGNEPGKEGAETRNPWLATWVKHWISVDPRRLYTSASGWPAIPENQYHVSHGTRGITGWFGRDYRDILEKAQLPRATVQRVTVPVIVHEMGQWCVYPNFDEIAKYTGPLKPKNFEIFRDSLAEHGMADRWEDFFTASGKLQVLCYKEEIEAALRTPGIGGIQLLDLHDFPGQGTALVGVLDPFWDAKPYVTAAQYRRFCNTTVPLARLLRRTWTSDETLTAEIEVAHFGAGPLTNAMPYWRVLADNEQVIAQGELCVCNIPIGQGTQLGTVAVDLRALLAPKRYKLVVGLKGTDYENDWDFWVYPPKSPPAPSNVLVTVSLDAAARMRLEAGGRVLVASARLGPDDVKLHFTPIFWNRFYFSKQSNSTLGLWCNARHPALAQFPTDYWQNCQWLDIIPADSGSATSVILDDWPRELQPIVQPIDDWNTNRRLGLIFECRVGKGKLLVCAADLSSDLDRRPAARQLRDSLMAYAGGDRFDPQVQVPVDQLANLWRE